MYSPPAPFFIGDTLPLPLAGKLFLLFEIPFPGKKWVSKPLLAYFKLYPLKKYSIDKFMIYSYIAFENLIKIIFSKKAKGVQYGIREIKGNHCRYFGM